MESKQLSDIAWNVSEETYRQDPAISYSTLAKFEREGFNSINHLFDRIENNEMYEKDSDKEFYNLWIAYMNGNDKYISEDYVKTLKKIDFCNNLDCFYALAITIFVIERCMNSLLS